MPARSKPWPEGFPCWVDVRTSHMEDAQTFYAAVLGWRFHDTAEEHGGYNLAERGGVSTAAIGPQLCESDNAWLIHFASNDVDRTAELVAVNGGEIVVEPHQVGSLARRSIARDATGALFGIWGAQDHIGVGATNCVGALTWQDLRSDRPCEARDFYSAVFGFHYDGVVDAGHDYRTFATANHLTPVGGIGGKLGLNELPTRWVVYFRVDDVAAATADANRLGGGVLVHQWESPNSSMAALVDPTGAIFWVIENDLLINS